jgi:AcrR family transcriptional regulator
MANTKADVPVRDRLLAAASALFYEEGIHTVGIDRVIARAGVAKASLYSTFGSKDELVRAYLQARAAARQARITESLAGYDGPRAKILGVFDVLGQIVTEPSFRGCAFVNASAEGPREDAIVSGACAMARAWYRQLFTGLLHELGVRDAASVGRRLALLYDGAMVGAAMDRDPSVVIHARALAELLLDAESRAVKTKSRAPNTKRPRPRSR